MVNIGLSKQEPASSLLQIMYNEVRQGMTLIVEEEEDECIIGAVVNAGSCPWDPDKFIEFARCECGPARDVIEFDAYVTGKPNLWERYCVLKIFECSYLAVRPDFRNQGIARKLVLDSWYLARDCGYRLFRVDCDNRWVQLADRGILVRLQTRKECESFRSGSLASTGSWVIFTTGRINEKDRWTLSVVYHNVQRNCYLVIQTGDSWHMASCHIKRITIALIRISMWWFDASLSVWACYLIRNIIYPYPCTSYIMRIGSQNLIDLHR